MNPKRLSFFVLLYFVQGVALAYFIGFQKRYLLSRGVAVDAIATLTSLALMPFILKPIFGLVADSFEIKRKYAIAAGLGLASVAFGSAMKVDPGEKFLLFSVLMILASVGVSFFDTMADALAVDAFEGAHFGPLQSAMLAGKSLGLILFSLVFGFMIDSSGYERVFVFLAFAMLVPFVIWNGIEHVQRKERFQWAAFRALGKREVVAIAIFGIIYSVPSFGVSGLFSFYFSHLKFAASQVGLFEAVKSVGAVVGALVFTLLSARFSLRSIAIAATIIAGIVSAAAPMNTSPVFLYTILAVFGMVWALRETVYTTLAMRITDPAIAATMFSLIMAFSNVGTSIGEGWATASAGRQGFAFTFVLFGALNVASLWYFRRPEQLPKGTGHMTEVH